MIRECCREHLRESESPDTVPAPLLHAVTILAEETADGTRVAYDTVSSALAIYPSGEDAMLTAQALDAEVLALLRGATQA